MEMEWKKYINGKENETGFSINLKIYIITFKVHWVLRKAAGLHFSWARL